METRSYAANTFANTNFSSVTLINEFHCFDPASYAGSFTLNNGNVGRAEVI